VSEGSLTIDIKGKNDDLDRSLKESRDSVEGWGKAVKATFVAVGAAIVAKKVFDFGKQLFSLYAEQEQAEKRLESVLNATGNAAGFTSDEMKDMASAMQEMTTIGDEVILQSQAIIATFKNIKGDQFKETLMVAADMAEVLGTDLKGASMQVAKALNDPLKGMSALSRAGVQFTEQQREQIKVLQESGDIVGAQKVILAELSGEFGGAAAAAADTFTGRLTQMMNTVGDIGEMIFQAFVPAMDALAPYLQQAVAFTKNWVGYLVENGEVMGNLVKRVAEFGETIVKWLVDKSIVAVSVFQAVFENMGTSLQLYLNTFQLVFVSVFNNLVHFLTQVIPGYLKWFVDNWRDIFTDVYNFTKTVFSNLMENLSDFWTALKSFLSGDGFNFEFTGLTEGFESSIKALPEIAERELGPFEKELTDRVSSLSSKLNDSINDKVAENRKAFADMFTFDSEGRKSFDEIEASLSTDPTFEPQDKDKKDGPKDKKDKESGSDTEDGSFTASRVGLEDISNKIQDAAASTQAKNQKSMTDSLKSMAEAQKQTSKKMETVEERNERHQKELEEYEKKLAEEQRKGNQIANEGNSQLNMQTNYLKNISDKVQTMGGLA